MGVEAEDAWRLRLFLVGHIGAVGDIGDIGDIGDETPGTALEVPDA
ncbi:hypothetical protein [Streptomyces sp. NPDC058398]